MKAILQLFLIILCAMAGVALLLTAMWVGLNLIVQGVYLVEGLKVNCVSCR